jgi:hypothetical protein
VWTAWTALAPLAASAGSQALQADHRGELALVTTETGARLRFASGAELELPLPARAAISRLAAGAAGWIATGSQTAAGRTRLLLLAGDERQARRLAPPRRRATAALQVEPVPLVGRRGLAGLAWLEGDSRQRLAVRAADWDGAGWGGPQEVAPPSAGSQLALAGAVLRDSSSLLVWSAFDGGDDEVLWSLRARASWSAPARLAADNAVPDIAPALVALPGGGAVAAWSRFDGREYRLALARFDGRAWREPEIVGPPGALYASFVAFADGRPEIVLLARRAAPRGWVAVSLDAAGSPSRVAELEKPGAQRPLLRPDGPLLHLAWPVERREATAFWRPIP